MATDLPPRPGNPSTAAPHRPVSIAIIGAGFSGIAAAIALKRAGYHDIVIYDRASGVGGVWRHNTYPGAACDVPSALYSFSYEHNDRWSRPFAPQAEIQSYLEHCADKYGLRRHIRLRTEIVSADFDGATGAWTLTTATGQRHNATILVPACGQLSRPRLPDIPGLSDFSGELFHSAEWDHSFDLTGKRVAVIGNGASAVQLVPHLARKAKKLTVFQRSAEYIIPKPDYQIPRVQAALFDRIPALHKAIRAAVWGVAEYANPAFTNDFGRLHNVYLAPFYLAAKAQLRLQVRDPQLRAKLTPSFRIGCKRVLLSSDYYPALTRPNTEVVTGGITGVAGNGILTADGVKREYDAVICATGFQTHGFIAPMRITGRHGLGLTEAWAGSPAAYLGMAVPGFPNLFLMYGPNTNFGSGSIVYILESQARYLADAVRQLDRGGARYLEVRQGAFDRFSAEARRRLAHSVWATGGCSSWYANGKGVVTTNWPGLMSEYYRRTRRVNLADYVLTI